MSDLTATQWRLVHSVQTRSDDVQIQVRLLLDQARAVGASTRDVNAAEAHLKRKSIRECRG